MRKRGPRGKAIPEVRWWLELARDMVLRDEREGGLEALGKELARVQGRSRGWSHSALSNFAHGKGSPTIELAEAIGIYFGIPAPVFFARSIPEALAMAKVREDFNQVEVTESTEEADILAFRRLHPARSHANDADEKPKKIAK